MNLKLCLCSKKKIISIDDIIIPKCFSVPKLLKILSHYHNYVNNSESIDPIIIDQDNVLIDGYISWLIFKTLKQEQVKVYQIKMKVKK